MALYSSINRRVFRSPLKMLASKIIVQPTINCFHYQPNDDKADILDDFTSRLMQRKINKWENQKIISERKVNGNKLIPEVTAVITQTKAETDISFLNIDEITCLFQRAININDHVTVMDLTKQCMIHDKIPSLHVLIDALSLCSRNGDRETIVQIANLCEKLRPEILENNSNFEHYLAEAIWIKGNIIKSLEIFEKVYKENIYLRHKIRGILKYLILDIVTKHSEATLVTLVRFSEKLANEYNDLFPLVCIWQSCFLSEWFTDQQLAIELLERNKGLCDAVVNRIPYVVMVSLKFHRTEVVYRLTEMLLRFNIASELVHVLLALIDYWIKKGDLRQCNEVIKWALKNKIGLPTVIENTKLIKMHKNGKIGPKPEENKPRRPPTEYKF